MTAPSRIASLCRELGVPRATPSPADALLSRELHALWSREYANLRASRSFKLGRTMLGPLAAMRDRAGEHPKFDWARIEPLLAGHGEFAFRPAGAIVGEVPRVAVVIPTRDNRQMLEPCVESVLRTCEGSRARVEVLVADNGSSESAAREYLAGIDGRRGLRVLDSGGPFNFARINNDAARQSDAEFVLLLNNDTEAMSAGWLDAMLAPMLADASVGIVGARLDYPEGRLQHAGLMLRPGAVASHPGRGASGADAARLRFPAEMREVAAVTAACLLVRRSVWEELGGMDEEFAVAFNDVDLCLRAGMKGSRCIYAPGATLIHKEGRSRGADDTPEKIAAFYREFALMRARWGPLLDADPFVPRELIDALGG